MTAPRSPRDLARFTIQRQPDDSTCGPTCLHAVYRHFGDDVPLDDLTQQVEAVEGGGTLGVLLATHALRRGYRATLTTLNLQVFDPTWFHAGGLRGSGRAAPHLRERLVQRAEAVQDAKLSFACRAYVDFVDAGGEIELHDIQPSLLRRLLRGKLPILTGLSATFLYREEREIQDLCKPDDILGTPSGHFVVLTGYDPERREVMVSDPLYPNALASEHTYPVPMQRLIGAIYLGVLTYDGNIIVVEPDGERP